MARAARALAGRYTVRATRRAKGYTGLANLVASNSGGAALLCVAAAGQTTSGKGRVRRARRALIYIGGPKRQPLARRRLGLKSHSRSSPVTGGLVLGACLQATRAARESFRTSGIHEYSRCPADSANGGG